MSTPGDSVTVATLRREVAAARSDVARLDVARVVAETRVDVLRRNAGNDDPATQAALKEAQAAAVAVSDTRTRLRGLETDLSGAIAGVLQDSAEQDFAGLATTFPIVLFPVRLETRFGESDAGPELRVRIYPDEISADAHEPELTDAERAAGEDWWRRSWNHPEAALDAWRALLVDAEPERAAWIVKATTPANANVTPRPETPVFAEPPLKTGVWTRAVEARSLPDRWVVLGFRGGVEVVRGVSAAVVEPLVLSLGPDLDDQSAVDISGDGLVIDPALAWTIEFDRAEAVGMAVRVRVTGIDLEDGFDTVLVLGVKSTFAPADGAAALSALLDAQHYSRGLAFVRQGTPTNNTRLGTSGVPPDDADGSRSFQIELGQPLANEGTDGGRVARALGVPRAVFDHVDRADANEQGGAAAMCDALWPATWGYFFDQLLDIDAGNAAVDDVRTHFAGHVRARGAFPAFRVGSTPYGLLVASSLQRWRTRGELTPLQAALPDLLRQLLPIWVQQVPNVPRVGASDDPDADLVKVLEMDASTREARIRRVFGPDSSFNLLSFYALNTTTWTAERARLATDAAQLVGRQDVASRVFTLGYDPGSILFAGGFVTNRLPDGREPLSETAALDFNYINWLRTASLDDLRFEKLPEGVDPPRSLLYLLLRHALLRQIADAGDRLLVQAGLFTTTATREVELVGMPVAAPTGGSTAAAPPVARTVWERLDERVPNVTGSLPLSRYLLEVKGQLGTVSIEQYRAGLEALETLPTAELERLLTETLDVCSHRIDAWITSLFTDRLSAMRDAGAEGAHVGAYGWVHDLRRAPSARTVPVAPDRLRALTAVAPAVLSIPGLATQVDSGGHIHAPSTTHAAAAAVLRNGYLSRRGANRDRYAINLSSARVRAARFLLDAVRNGQPIGAVLGYQFERGLHEGHEPLSLDKYIEPFRTAFPLVANKVEPAAPGEPTDAIAARNVVDGLLLRAAFEAGTIPFGTGGLPAPSGDDRTAVESELRRLDETVDALADLLTAESVFQLMRGSASTAGATLDALARGVRPPDPEVARSPRGGSSLIHRIALVLGGDPIEPAGWGDIPPTPRSRAEPWLDGWIGALVGDPHQVRCRVTYTDASDQTVTHTRDVSLADLNLRPIDILAALTASQTTPQTAAMQSTSAQVAELDARIAFHVLGEPDAADDARVDIQYGTDDPDALSVPQIAELARCIAALLGRARPLAPRDLLAPDRAAEASSADLLAPELDARATAALQGLVSSISALDDAIAPLDVDPRPDPSDLGPIRAALAGASLFGVEGSIPGSRKGRPDQLEPLLRQAQSVRAELDRRRSAAEAATSSIAIFAAVFGAGFLVVPRFVPAAGELSQALAVGPAPTPTSSSIRRWLHGVARVRSAMGSWRKLTLVARALGSTVPEPKIAQLPHIDAPWAADAFGDEAQRPSSGIVSLALLNAAGAAADAPWAALAIDEWTELIPNSVESTAIAFHYDDPGAEAPQAILIAVPPDDAPTWSLSTLSSVLGETLELAKIRVVDGELLGALSQLLPAIYLAANAKRDTVTTQFGGLLTKDAVIAQVN